ncbi:toll-like receptor 7 [Chironomus tepperi]|uniref:toll-like receptor 7 n=1 Tax=Chironomus tepperi TaxID=113505 RepID=UPI00391F6F71
MKCRALKVLILLTFMISASVQEEASVSCVRDTRLFFGSDRLYSNSMRYKCTFTNVNSLDDMKTAIAAQSINAMNIISISFNQSNLSEFPDRAFRDYSSLKSLDGSNLRLSTMTSSSLVNFVGMDLINLSFNQIQSLTTKVFANKKIKLLDLSNNIIDSVDESAFTGCEIDRINLSFNKIKDVAFVSFFKFFNNLQMNNNEVERFDQVKLTTSSWSGARDGFLIPQFPTINLVSNKLTKFECRSTFKFVLIELKSNENLKELDLGECMINHLDVSDCDNLKTVKLTDNLVGFTAQNVKFDSLDLSTANSLSSLKLINNSLNTAMIDAIMKLENLTTLDISRNSIGPLNISTFAKLKNLSTLGLKSTNISNIQFGTFSHQTNVRVLDISDNNLGSFDMQMIFSMNSLTYLDVSGNELIELSNIDAAHNTFALLEKIDLTNNKWTCSYLIKLIKIMRAYRVTLIQSSIEEHRSNIHGIYCRHVDGDDSIVEPLSPNQSNITDIRDKMNEIVGQLTKESQYRSNVEDRLTALEKRIDNQVSMIATNEALRAVKSNETQNIQVRNGTLFEMTLIVVFCCFIVFMSMKIIVFVRTNILSKPRPMRMGLSENTLTMNVDDY